MALPKIKMTKNTDVQVQAKENKFSKKIISTGTTAKVTTHAHIQNSVGQGNLQLIPIDKIEELTVNGKIIHNRTSYSQENIESLALDIKEARGTGALETGLDNPITVRKKQGEKNSYERIAGFRRILAFKLNGETHIPAIVTEADDKAAITIRYSENSQREKLNDYDDLITILDLLSFTIKKDKNSEVSDEDFDHTVNIIRKSKKHYEKNKKSPLSIKEQEDLAILEDKLSKVATYGISGLENRLNILKMNPLIVDEMKKNQIAFSHADEIRKTNFDDLIIKDLLIYNREEKPTVRELKQKILQLKQKLIKKITSVSVVKKIKEDFSSLKITRYNKLTDEKKELADSIAIEIDIRIKELKLILEH